VEAVAGKLVGRDILPQVAGGSQTAPGTGLESVDAIVRLVGQRTVSGEPKPQESVGFARCDSFAGGVKPRRHGEIDRELGDDRCLRATGLVNDAQHFTEVFNADLHKLMSTQQSC
jgi:hypothetical protein